MSPTRRAWSRVLRRYVAFVFVWMGVLILSWATFARGRRLGGTAAWAGLLQPVVFGLTAWPVLRQFARGKRWLTIPNAVLSLTYISIGLGSVYFVFHYDDLTFGALRRPGAVRASLVVTLIGVLAYRIGAALPWARASAKRLPALPATPNWSWGARVGVLTAIVLAVCSKLYLAATGSLGYVTGADTIVNTGLWSLVAYVSQVGLLALAGAYFYWFSGASLTKGDRIFVVAATAALASIGLLSAMKQEFLFVLLSVAIPYACRRREASRRRSEHAREFVFGAGLLTLTLLLFSINPLFRTALVSLRPMESRIEQGREAGGLVLDRISSGRGVGSLLATGAQDAWRRLSVFPYEAAVIDQVPESRPFQGFGRYRLLPALTFVPRVLWPSKPVNVSGRNFQRTFISGENINSTTPTVYGWAYWEGGIAGVVVVLVSLGAIAGVVESYLGRRQAGKLAAVIPYTALFLALGNIEPDPLWLVGGLPKAVVGAVIVYGLFAWPGIPPKQRRRSSVTVEQL